MYLAWACVTSTRRRRPPMNRVNASRVRPSESRGATLTVPSWRRSPPKPLTSAIQVPASEGDVEPVAGVVLKVAQVDQGGLAEEVVGQVEVAGLGGYDRLAAGRQRGVPDGQPLVVGEVPRLLLRRERAAVHLHGQ